MFNFGSDGAILIRINKIYSLESRKDSVIARGSSSFLFMREKFVIECFARISKSDLGTSLHMWERRV